jgi:hypothetical protein
MSDSPISRRTLNNLTSYRTSLLSAIGHLRGIEENTANQRARPPVTRPPASVPDTQICEGCHSTGHHYTECLNHPYVWDSEANARLLAPDERLSAPANWQDIHRASLHHLIRTVLQYYISLHHTRIQDIHTLLTDIETNSQFGDIRCFVRYGNTGEAPDDDTSNVNSDTSETYRDFDTTSTGSSPLPTTFPPPEHGPPGLFLINLAVLAATTRLRIDPWNETTGYIQFIALHHWHPSFGIVFPDFLRLIHTELRERRLHQTDIFGDQNPFDINIGPPTDQPNSPFEEP